MTGGNDCRLTSTAQECTEKLAADVRKCLKAGCPADNLSELEVVPNPEQRDMADWSDESDESGGESDSDEDCSWLYQS